MIKDGYKSRSIKDRADTNIPLSVQPWGKDGDKRRYWLIEGRDDTPFRVYRESNPALKNVSWWSVAGSIEELQVLAKKLEEEDGHRDAKQLSVRITASIPRFEASEEVKYISHPLRVGLCILTRTTEAQEACLPSRAQAQARAHARIPIRQRPVRRPHSRPTHAIQLLRGGRGGLGVWRSAVDTQLGSGIIRCTPGPHRHVQRPPGPLSRNRRLRRVFAQRPDDRSPFACDWRLRSIGCIRGA